MEQLVEGLFGVLVITVLLIGILAAFGGLFTFSRWLIRCVREENCSRDLDSDY